MGNWWKGISDQQHRECEERLLEINGLSRDDYRIRNVEIGNGSDDHYIHEIHVKGNKEGLPTLVMIHGYMSGGIQFCKMLPKLRDHFEVRTIDLLGMGASGRPQGIKFKSFEDCIGFFIDSINKYVKVSGIAKEGNKFYLLGHSMGGLISGHYALAH